jgi:hypothetical protein
MDPDSDLDPAIFVIDLEDTNKKLVYTNFCSLLFEGTFTSFFKDKKSKRSHKTVGIQVFLTIFVSCLQCCGSGMFIPDPDFVQKSNKRGVKKFVLPFLSPQLSQKLCFFELVKKKFGLIYKELTFYL